MRAEVGRATKVIPGKVSRSAIRPVSTVDWQIATRRVIKEFALARVEFNWQPVEIQKTATLHVAGTPAEGGTFSRWRDQEGMSPSNAAMKADKIDERRASRSDQHDAPVPWRASPARKSGGCRPISADALAQPPAVEGAG
jgi:hypothetical protein